MQQETILHRAVKKPSRTGEPIPADRALPGIDRYCGVCSYFQRREGVHYVVMMGHASEVEMAAYLYEMPGGSTG